MTLLTSILSLWLVPCALLVSADSYHSKPIELVRDVAIIGGGASGTYAAVRLREDLNKSIVLIEPQSNLGGHTNTYRVPGTNYTIDFGVQSYLPYGPALEFFARFGITTQPFVPKRLTALNVDVETGKELKGYITPSANATNEAFKRWLDITSKYKEMLEPGYWDFPLPSAIPEDFLTPFVEFAKKYEIEAAIPRILAISGAGYGGLRHLITLNIFQAFGYSLTKGMLNDLLSSHLPLRQTRAYENIDIIDGTLFQPIDNNGLLYQRALALLRSDVLLSSFVQDAKRTSNGVELSVKQGDTEYTIKARRVLYTAGPSLENLAPFHPDSKETAVFSNWTSGAEFVGVIKAPCIPENYSITYLPSAVVPSNQFALKDWPYSLRLDSTGPSGQGLFRVVFGANYTLSEAGFKDLTMKSIEKLHSAGTIAGTCATEFKAVSNHTRPQWKETAAILKKGFVQDLYGLQGYKSMWYTGYAWAVPYSSTIWAFTDTVLDRLLVDLKSS
ncbi:amine oxidase [Pyrenophora seminiperda CCB06]|uniref:Amine oxidase n=1 Tax=Pyrenophora seminiperda CCB06 TaxID=1302712 RepID=A0A3M7LXR3_9PLEO|nr:amine oxidase [Pyrenophora seminiperda CCB06]